MPLENLQGNNARWCDQVGQPHLFDADAGGKQRTMQHHLRFYVQQADWLLSGAPRAAPLEAAERSRVELVREQYAAALVVAQDLIAKEFPVCGLLHQERTFHHPVCPRPLV